MRGAPGGRVDSETILAKSETKYQIQLNTRETENAVPRSQASDSHLDPAAPPPGTGPEALGGTLGPQVARTPGDACAHPPAIPQLETRTVKTRRTDLVKLARTLEKGKKSQSISYNSLGGFRNLGPPGPLPPPPAPPRADCPKASRGGRTLALVPRCLSLSPQRRAPWHTFEFANPLRVRGLLRGGGRVSAPAASQADTHQGTPKPGEPGRMPSHCFSTAWEGAPPLRGPGYPDTAGLILVAWPHLVFLF